MVQCKEVNLTSDCKVCELPATIYGSDFMLQNCRSSGKECVVPKSLTGLMPEKSDSCTEDKSLVVVLFLLQLAEGLVTLLATSLLCCRPLLIATGLNIVQFKSASCTGLVCSVHLAGQLNHSDRKPGGPIRLPQPIINQLRLRGGSKQWLPLRSSRRNIDGFSR